MVTTRRDAALLARQHGFSVTGFAPHPWLDAFAALWAPPPPVTRAPERQETAGHRDVTDRERRAIDADSVIGHALASVSWHRISTLPSTTSSQRSLYFRIRSLRISGWVSDLGRCGCPHCPDATSDGGHTFHIFWWCAAAQSIWTCLRDVWAALGLWYGAATETVKDFQTAVFGLRLPCTPKGIWTLISPDPTAAQAVSAVQEALTAVWVLQVLSAFRTIWQWRHSHLSDGRWHADKAKGIARAAFAAAIHRVRRDVDRAHGRCVAGAALAAVSSAFSTPAPPRAPATDARYVLFFDGGSRGNPGPGGAGSVILRTDVTASTATLIWSAAMSLADRTTTNNQAEYVGLLIGLQAALQQGWSPLAVVGDSSLVLRQMRDYRRPLNARLLALYGKARFLADRIGVTSWTHHLRAWNKMADAAANVAMDCQRSLQTFRPSDRPEWRNLDALLPGDFAQWQSAT